MKHAKLKRMDVTSSRQIECKESDASAKSVEKSPNINAATTAEIFTRQAEVTSEIADLGIEDGEGFSEGEQSGKSKGEGRAYTKSDQKLIALKTQAPAFPPPSKMKKEVIKAIREEIRKNEKEVILAYLGIKKVKANVFADMVAQLRQLKNLLAGLIDVTADIMKSLYSKWVRKES